MHVVFLDEFGHIGPFVARSHPNYKTSPVFGMAGFMIDSENVRDLSTWFHKLKASVFANEIEQSGIHQAHWEKKGNQLFTHSKAYKTKRLGFALINQIKAHGGKIIYQGLEKYETPEDSNGPGLYKAVLSSTIRAVERRFAPDKETYAIILDQHNDRDKLLVSAQQTMYSRDHGAYWLMEPPYQVESHMYPSVQMADWIAAIVGSLWNFKTKPEQFPDEEWAAKYFEARIDSASTHSSVRRIPVRQPHLRLEAKAKPA
ncbi:DUF3800 domain-containing protein [Mesorhizobium sp.]|uniref:DUF3800 domain-containing protein n=1 Tax=Mesorhizobium sp. TaxID=1871066 RepID=UPI0025E32623|nr:DUF3800 domain-containing protein [Mesorhizobium sp.]